MVDAKLRKALLSVQKPGRYTGGEPGEVIKKPVGTTCRFAFCFPDTYELGMSHLGLKVLYEELNSHEDIWCERAFMPWVDMKETMEKHGISLYALESKTPLAEMDILGFTLQYELSYTNILAMLALAGVPLHAEERDEHWPLVLAGGPCACNAEPLAPFFDAMLLGEGEEITAEICKTYKAAKAKGLSKKAILQELMKLEGVYIPGFYDVEYNKDGTVKCVTPKNGAPASVQKAMLKSFAQTPPPVRFITPVVGTVHDRATVEVLRGCFRGCRFCQAGYIYRPLRERPVDMLNTAAKDLCDFTGYDEVSLSSLSTSDHTGLETMMDDMLTWTKDAKINLALPSLRVDNFSQSLVEKVSTVRKSGLTFAPEAGTQRMRDVINKNVTEEEIERTCSIAFNAGYSTVKLYFMIGLPGETMEDIEGIAKTAGKVIDIYYKTPGRAKGKPLQVSIGCASFIPKPFTPFQFFGQNSSEELAQKQRHLIASLPSKKIHVSYTDANTSLLEAVFARGDRRLAKVLLHAYESGCVFDGWSECFDFERWQKAFEKAGLNMNFYAQRQRLFNEVLPYDHLNYCIDKTFLIEEYEKAMAAIATPPCNLNCAGCGANKQLGGPCFANNI